MHRPHTCVILLYEIGMSAREVHWIVGRVSRFTVSVPSELLDAVDEKLVKGAESRSEVVRRLLAQALCEADEKEKIERYIQGYREDPQSEEEFGWSDRSAGEHFSEIPWK